jgi:hypothetical protein
MRSGRVFTFVEGGAADPAQPFQVAPHRADIGPGDLIRLQIEVFGAQADEAPRIASISLLRTTTAAPARLLSCVLLIRRLLSWLHHTCSELQRSQADKLIISFLHFFLMPLPRLEMIYHQTTKAGLLMSARGQARLKACRTQTVAE